MKAYLDSSVILRWILNERRQWADLPSVKNAATSALTEVECLRSIDRLRHNAQLSQDEVAEAKTKIYEFIDGVELIELTRNVLKRASQPLALPLRTLDALHLVSALMRQEGQREKIIFATHDEQLKKTAQASGLTVAG